MLYSHVRFDYRFHVWLAGLSYPWGVAKMIFSYLLDLGRKYQGHGVPYSMKAEFSYLGHQEYLWRPTFWTWEENTKDMESRTP